MARSPATHASKSATVSTCRATAGRRAPAYVAKASRNRRTPCPCRCRKGFYTRINSGPTLHGADPARGTARGAGGTMGQVWGDRAPERARAGPSQQQRQREPWHDVFWLEVSSRGSRDFKAWTGSERSESSFNLKSTHMRLMTQKATFYLVVRIKDLKDRRALPKGPGRRTLSSPLDVPVVSSIGDPPHRVP